MTPVDAITADTFVARAESPLAAQVDGRTILLSLARGNYYDLDTVATEIWALLERPLRVRELCAELAGSYDADVATIERDVAELLNRLAAEGLVEADAANRDDVRR